MAENKKQWFVVHTYSGYENKVKENLIRRTGTMNMENYIFRVIVPMEDEVQVKDGQRKVVKRKVYPGYVMVEMVLTDDSWYVVRNTTGVTGFVGTGSKPVPLADNEVQMILRQMGYEEAVLRLDYSVGEKVRVIDGSFAGVTGTVLEINQEKNRIKVQVDMLGSTATVDLDNLQLEKHGKTGTKDISIGEVRESRWGYKKLSSATLDYLYNTGVLTVTDKRGTQKYFDLTERVIDSGNLSCNPNMTVEEFLEWYVERRIQSVGFLWNKSGGAWQGRFLSENELRSSTLQTLIEKNRIEES